MNYDNVDDPTARRRALLQQMPGEDQTNPLGATPGTIPPVTGPTLGVTDPTARVDAAAPPLTPDAPAAPAPGMAAAPTAAYLQSLIKGGMDPHTAIAQFNKETGRTHGNEAEYYDPSVHGVATIGLPEAYLAADGGNGDWTVTQRTPENNAPAGSPAGRGGAPGGGSQDPFGFGIQGLDMNGIMAELQALIAGQKSPSGRSALLSQMKG